ncbi:hypothetical protein RhiirA5_396563 [Rhizophagus irregularis]|uniref:Small ribosomal subunit protein mS29 n=3 Tax=Rhizophagus irregularis TaxID=588596 RepID=A0A2I1E565_9GLOM|nr:hypothetical protein GLOIN_2v1491035 [Rhizophagus irregularis DAOM 181602=DAOM 197198]EXX52686.1 hypothetical protein RirG_250860 [Rhizophagus irregularis DAOM 197198w]PKC12980.1 hypothetical protein RhiirA5_396563 [Rhizophagus irregularis]PKC70559.1 hypothetical protein RhiirA1_532621 [Rhizophagus irregularis]PKY17264.1 hypothetical protein RhiirB3_467847 [Rhizophagus irregularis]POG83286.1 hypothetical protein GLOIN_2v1491035 [Rhizophagus irregularis DAOM 181602=DAOM 197198]|eukprot:XP_025190152.1 hypothetical protein GLOIN_2v1491035 [Rhizophagus irregularis DAOM 181602=DAOM 197198]
MLSLHLYTKIIPGVNSIIPRTSIGQSFLTRHPIQNAIQSPLISSSLIIQQKRTGTAKPKYKTPKEKQVKTLGFKQKKTKKESSRDVEIASTSSSGRGGEEFYKPAPDVILNDMFPEVFTNENVGKIYQIPKEVIPKFKVFKFPMSLSKEFELFHNSSLVVRQSSVELIKLLEEASTLPSTKNRHIISGPLGIGKSALLMQAVNYAMCKPWIVIYIPHAVQYVNSTSPYMKVESTGEFIQPTLTMSLLQQIKLVNEPYLRNINLRRGHQIHRHVIKDKNTSQLLEIGINDPHSAQEVFEIFLEEIGNNQEYPVLLAVDEINAFYTDSKYFDVDDTLLEANRLSLPRTILEYFSGKKDFTYGAVIGALSQTFKPFISKPLEIALGLTEASPWKPVSRTILQYTTGLQNFDVKGYSKDEAKAVIDYYYEMSILPQPKEQLFVKHFLATNGNPRKFYLACWKGL